MFNILCIIQGGKFNPRKINAHLIDLIFALSTI